MAKVFLAEERDRIGWGLAQRVREGSMPPDDAYQWVRVLCEMTRKLHEKEPDSMFTNTPVIKFLTVLLLALATAGAAQAQTIEVRNGDAAALQAAVRNTGATVLVYNGTYQTTSNGTDVSENGGFAVANGVTLKAAPGQSPLLTNCPVSQTTYCPRPTITASASQNVTIEGLRIHGGIWIYGTSAAIGQGSKGLVIRGNDVDQGWGEVDDGNWAALFLQNITGGLVQGNTFHDVSVPSGGGQQSSGSCVKLYENTDTIVEQNTCRNVPIPESQAGGIDDKAQAQRNIHRFNWIENVNTCIRINNQLQSTGVQVYGNVCVAGAAASSGRPGVRVIDLVDGLSVFNNTFLGYPVGLQIFNEGGAIRNVRWYNNIVQGATVFNVETYQAALIAPSNYNAWTPGLRWMYAGAQNTLAQWKGRGFDAAGAEVDCQVSATTGKLASGSPCLGAGRVGGVSTGAAVDRGAFGVTACVGATCSSTPPPPPPPPPPTCTFAVSTTAIAVPVVGGAAPIGMTTGATCVWPITTTDAWLHLSSTSNTGPGQVTIIADANAGAARTGIVTVGGQAVAVTQPAFVPPPPPPPPPPPQGASYAACVTILNNQVTAIVPGACPAS